MIETPGPDVLQQIQRQRLDAFLDADIARARRGKGRPGP